MGMSMGMISAVFVPLYFLYSLIIAPGNKMGMVRIIIIIRYLYIYKYIFQKLLSFYYTLQKYKNATSSILSEFPERKSLPPNQKILIGLEEITVPE